MSNLEEFTTPLQGVREVLAGSEPLTDLRMVPGEDLIKWNARANWAENDDTIADDEIIKVTVSINGENYDLTREAYSQAAGFIGLSDAFIRRTEPSIINAAMNWWYGQEIKPPKGLVLPATNTILAVTKQTIVPFSTLKILSEVGKAIRVAFPDAEIAVSRQFSHCLRETRIPLIFPNKKVAVRSADDFWSPGLLVTNSLTGKTKTSVTGLVFRHKDGAMMSLPPSFAGSTYFDRTSMKHVDPYEWSANTAEAQLRRIPDMLKLLSQAAQTNYNDGSGEQLEIVAVLRALYAKHNVPAGLRDACTERLIETDDISAYGIATALAWTGTRPSANGTARSRVLDASGQVLHDLVCRCESCGRM